MAFSRLFLSCPSNHKLHRLLYPPDIKENTFHMLTRYFSFSKKEIFTCSYTQSLPRNSYTRLQVQSHIHQQRLRRGFRTKCKSKSFTKTEKKSFIKEFEEPVKNQATHNDKQPISHLRRFLFTGTMISGSFICAMIWKYESWRSHFQDSKNKGFYDAFKVEKKLHIRQYLNDSWVALSKAEQLCFGTIAVNLAVFALWKNPRCYETMTMFFLSSNYNPVSSMFFASFSHISFLHLFCNMCAFWSFGKVIGGVYGNEESAAVYVSAGTFASFVSISINTLLKRNIVSLGASGAVFGLLGVFCSTFPEGRLQIMFLDALVPHSFSADSAMKTVIFIDVLGLLLGWRVIDHAGHLGGILFGIMYAKYGHNLFKGLREPIMTRWHEFRGKP